ncbi:hypothetical protein AB0478_18440 [Streptomyces sp. NPDC051917]|uniref:hypothetical protein n=1 Tax=Streptomyces sp. NPDC051917 TaxID=3154754 RepID=UPI00344C7639
MSVPRVMREEGSPGPRSPQPATCSRRTPETASPTLAVLSLVGSLGVVLLATALPAT